jgi:hypothetical protein
MAIGFNRHDSGKKTYRSTSGWERSWFGGYTRMIWDHPYIDIDLKVDLKPQKELSRDIGVYAAEKLLKMYLLQAGQAKVLDRLERTVETRVDFFGKEKKYEIYSLNDDGVFDRILEKNPELSPLFDHYKEGILGSKVEMEIKENKSDDDGDGEGEGDDKKTPPSGKDSPKEKEGKAPPRKMKTLKELLGRIKVQERSSWASSSSLSSFDKKPVFKPLEESRDTYRFTQQEIQNAEMLLKMLDIDFEPKSDVVKSLRLGKLDTSKIAEVPAGNVSIYKQIVEEQDTRPFTVCILGDLSGSMKGETRLDVQFSVMNSLFLAMREILPPDKLFVYGHSGENIPEIYTFYSPYEPDYEKRISQYYGIPTNQNYDGPVIEAIHKKIRGITDDRIIFIVLSDGEPAGNHYGSPQDREDLKKILERCRRDEFVTVGVGIQSFHVEGLYTYSKVVYDLRLMSKEVSALINRVVRTEFK